MKDTVEFKDFQNTGNSNMTSGGYTTNYEKLTQVIEIIKCLFGSTAGLFHLMATPRRPFIRGVARFSDILGGFYYSYIIIFTKFILFKENSK